uniref:Tetraspanin n=1 Tax=Nothobranchius furzeri TaxID=105023 RepID=A0A8C6LZW3_NOTFU
MEGFQCYSLMDYFLKYFMFLCNLLFTVLGLIVLTLGVWGLNTKESFAQENIGTIGTDPMLILFSLGFLLTLLCLTGCVGALREYCCLLKVFSATVLVLITAQVLLAIVVYSVRDQIAGYLRSGMLAAMANYQDDPDVRFITDEIQFSLQCCGADNYRDWGVNMSVKHESLPLVFLWVLACGNGTVWNSQCGCLGGITHWINQHEGLIGTVGTIVVGVEILAVFITTRLLETVLWAKMPC